jgi:hypothetical protein
MYVLLSYSVDTSVLLCGNVAQSECTGCHRLCHACWFFVRRIAGQLCGRSDWSQENRHPFRYNMGGRLYIAMFSRRMRPSFHLPGDMLNCRTGPRHANHRPNYLRCIRWYRIYHHSALSVRNCRALNPRSPRLGSTMVYHMGYSHPIFHTIRLLLHRRRRVFPNTMGSPGNSGRCTFYRHDCLPRIPSVAHRPSQVLNLIPGSLCLSNSSPLQRGRSAQSTGGLTRRRKSYGRIGTVGV